MHRPARYGTRCEIPTNLNTRNKYFSVQHWTFQIKHYKIFGGAAPTIVTFASRFSNFHSLHKSFEQLMWSTFQALFILLLQFNWVAKFGQLPIPSKFEGLTSVKEKVSMGVDVNYSRRKSFYTNLDVKLVKQTKEKIFTQKYAGIYTSQANFVRFMK